jgi:hypothetical protein
MVVAESTTATVLEPTATQILKPRFQDRPRGIGLRCSGAGRKSIRCHLAQSMVGTSSGSRATAMPLPGVPPAAH